MEASIITNKVSFSLETVAGVLLIKMELDSSIYVMLNTRPLAFVPQVIRDLQERLNIHAVMLGTAFRYVQTEKQLKLVINTDPNVVGIYVLLADYWNARSNLKT